MDKQFEETMLASLDTHLQARNIPNIPQVMDEVRSAIEFTHDLIEQEEVPDDEGRHYVCGYKARDGASVVYGDCEIFAIDAVQAALAMARHPAIDVIMVVDVRPGRLADQQ